MNKTVSFEGDTVHYRISGAGKPLIFLHGFLEDSSIWESIRQELFNDFQVIIVDLPGHGMSTNIAGDQSMASMASMVRLICLKESVKNPIVFGHSMGGYVALELSKIFVSDIALIHSNFWKDSQEKRNDRNRIVKIVGSNLPLFVSTAIPNLFFKENSKRCETQIKNLIAKASEIDSKSVIAVTKGMRDRLDNSNVLEKTNVAIVQGVNDSVFTQEMMTQQLKKITNKPYYIEINACGHMGFAEQPVDFLNAIKLIIDKFSGLNAIN